MSQNKKTESYFVEAAEDQKRKDAEMSKFFEEYASLTTEEKTFGLYNGMRFNTLESVLKIKKSYKKVCEFSFLSRLKAAFALMFRNVVTDNLSAHVLRQINKGVGLKDSIDSLISVSDAHSIDKRPLEYAANLEKIKTLKTTIEEEAPEIVKELEDKAIIQPLTKEEILDKVEEPLFSSPFIETKPVVVETTKTNKSQSIRNKPSNKKRKKILKPIAKKKKKTDARKRK